MRFADKQKKPAITQIVPEWYDTPRRQGASPEALREKVVTFCREALAHHAAETGEAVPTEPESDWVDNMIVMYEAAYGEVSA